MGKWNHAICWKCWREQRGNEEPCRVKDDTAHACCFCGKSTASGIYVRKDPGQVACGGYAWSHQD